MGKRGRPPHPDILTPREWQVLALLREGLTNEQIASRLDISLATAKYHVSEILSKLGVQTREQAAAWQPPAERAWFERALAPLAAVLRRLGPLTPAKAAIAAGVAAIVGIAILVWASARTAEDSGRRPMLAPPGPVVAGTLIAPDARSPDVRWESGLYVLRPDGSDLRYIGGEIADDSFFGSTSVNSYAWSPDGSQLAFARLGGSRDDPASLRIVTLSSEEASDMSLAPLTDVTGFSWSPDGSDILVAGSVPAESFSSRYVLVRVRTDEGSAAKIFESPGVAYQISTPSWAPDGQQFIFSDDQLQMRVFNLEGETVDELGEGQDPLWSPDGEWVLYRDDDGGGLYLTDRDGSQHRQLVTRGWDAEWSPDGRLITYLDENAGVQVYDLQTGLSRAFGRGKDPAWSPDGQRIVFVRDGNLSLVEMDGGGETRITGSAFPFIARPSWSPSGGLLAVRYRPGIDSTIYVADAGGGGERRLVPGSGPTWSPDGELLAFMSGFSGTGFYGSLYIMRADGTDIREVAKVSFSDNIMTCQGGGAALGWSPDGGQLRFSDSETIYLADVRSEAKPVAIVEHAYGAEWLPDGRLFYVRPSGGIASGCAIYSRTPPYTGEEELIFDDGFSPSASPDGSRLAFLPTTAPG